MVLYVYAYGKTVNIFTVFKIYVLVKVNATKLSRLFPDSSSSFILVLLKYIVVQFRRERATLTS